MKKRYKRQKLKALELAKQFELDYNTDPNNHLTIELFTLTGLTGEWNVGYNLYNSCGSIIDGPLVMIIDENDQIISLDEYIMRRHDPT